MNNTFFQVAERNIMFPHPKGTGTLTANQLFKLSLDQLTELATNLYEGLPKEDKPSLFSFMSKSKTRAEIDAEIRFRAVKEVAEFKYAQSQEAQTAAKKREMDDRKQQIALEGMSQEELEKELAKM